MDLIDSVHAGLLSVVSPAGRHGRLTILSFHRVLKEPDPLYPSEPDVSRFRLILDLVKSVCCVVSLEEGVVRLTSGSLPPRALAVTLDDGYRNNLRVAKPALVEFGLPATVFVAAAPVRQGIMWNDRIVEALRGAHGVYDLQDIGLGYIDVNDENRIGLIERLTQSLKYLECAQREEVTIEILRRMVGHSCSRVMLTEDEVIELEGDGITLGSHTLTHPILLQQSDAEASAEIVGSREWLMELTGRAPSLFAYPNGRRGCDYDERHVEMVRSAGFSAAVSTEWGAAHRGLSLYELPRYTPWERSRSGFLRRLIKTCAASHTH
ncbi:MAG: polysaccharide deacetylase family protein [Roseibium album]|uniref:polysaccharide deacetylase family protein n=1 Tax=Roseibium album TaxID=311410 RepID=UPI0032EDD305